MKILTKEKWSLFKQDGKLFESLVEELLKIEYPNANFKHTGWTRDGGKDFESELSFFNGNEKAWAECKYHQKTLPIHDVSMTLFMAYIESAQTILFFSYAPVNSEFHKYIDLYQKKSDKIIKIFDDIALEELILKNKEKIKFSKYFGDYYPEETVESDGVTYKYWVHSKNQTKALHINELVRLEFSASNHSSKEKIIKIKLKHNRCSRPFKIVNSSIGLFNEFIEIKIPPNGIAGCSIVLKLEQYSSKLRYPTLMVENGTSSKNLIIRNLVECLWLAEVPLLGEQNRLFIERMPQFLNTESANIGMLTGRSGTGKSRLIDEIITTTTILNYKKISFDADITTHLSSKSFFRKIVSELEDIPELSHITAEKIKKKYLAETGENIYSSFALQILFDDNMRYADMQEQLIDYLIHMLSNGKYFISLDNIQFYDEDILKIFQMIVQRHTELSSSFILFSANTDYIYDDTLADKLIEQINYMEGKFPHQFFCKKTKDFEKAEAYEYLQKCLNDNTNNFKKETFNYEFTLKKIIDIYGTNPLFLQNYLIYLYQEGIIKQTDYASYYIEDVDRLQKSFREIPDKIYSLLKLREERFIADVVSVDVLEKYTQFVEYLAFARWMPYNMIISLVDIPTSVIQSMEKIGLIKQNDKGEYGFYHQQIEEYYKNKYSYKKMTNDTLKKFCDVALKQINRKNYIECIFLAQYMLNQVDEAIWLEITFKICSNDISVQKTQDVCTAASNILDNSSPVLLPLKYVDIYMHMTDLLTNRMGILGAQELYQFVYKRFCRNPETFNDYLPELIQMLRTYIINVLHLNQPQNSLEICQKTIGLLHKHYANYISINYLLLNIYESQVFIYNEMQELDKALEVSDIVMDLAQKTNIVHKQINACYMRGDIYYTNVHACDYTEKICAYWEKAALLYEKSSIKVEESFDSLALYLNVYMRKVLLNILQEDFEKASKYMEPLRKYIGKTKMPFFEIKLRHLVVCFEIFSTQNRVELLSQYDKLDSYIKESIDTCAIYGSQTLYLDCFHLLAILQRTCNRNEYAFDNYQKSFSILNVLLGRQENAFHWIHFILDIVIAMRQLNRKDNIPPHIWQLVPKDMQERLYTICNIEIENLNDYLATIRIASPLYYKKEFIHFPKI